MHEDGHPSLDQLMALITAGDNETAHQLANECARCRENARWVRWVLGTARADRLTAPPPAVLQRAIDIFAGISPAAQPMGSLRRLIGTLIFDNYRMPALSPARGSQRLARQVRYQVPELALEVDLQLERDPDRQDRFALTGQVLPDAGIPLPKLARAVVRADPGGDVFCALYETGEFVAESLKSEPHTLLIRTESHEIALPVLGLQDD
jgi:hypothetical protein